MNFLRFFGSRFGYERTETQEHKGGGRYLKYRPPGRRFNYRPPPGRRNSGSPWLAGAPPRRTDCLSVLNPLLAAAMTARRARPWPIGHAAPSSSPLPRHPAGRASFPPPRPEAAARRRRSHAARKQVRRQERLVHTHAGAGEAGLALGAARWARPVVWRPSSAPFLDECDRPRGGRLPSS